MVFSAVLCFDPLLILRACSQLLTLRQPQPPQEEAQILSLYLKNLRLWKNAADSVLLGRGTVLYLFSGVALADSYICSSCLLEALVHYNCRTWPTFLDEYKEHCRNLDTGSCRRHLPKLSFSIEGCLGRHLFLGQTIVPVGGKTTREKRSTSWSMDVIWCSCETVRVPLSWMVSFLPDAAGGSCPDLPVLDILTYAASSADERAAPQGLPMQAD